MKYMSDAQDLIEYLSDFRPVKIDLRETSSISIGVIS